MDQTKYIVVEIMVGVSMFETPLLFPSFVGHDDLVRSLGVVPGKVLGAGFVDFIHRSDHRIDVRVFGGSTSLGVESRVEEDGRLIRKALGLLE